MALGVSAIEWSFDNSLWVDADEPPSEADLSSLCHAALGLDGDVLIGPLMLLDVWTSPEGRSARTYRCLYRSSRIALSRDRALGINSRVMRALSSLFSRRADDAEPAGEPKAVFAAP